MIRQRTPVDRTRWIPPLLIALGILLGAWHNRAVARGSNDPLTVAVRSVLVPCVNGLLSVQRGIGGQFSWVYRSKALSADNERLRQENDRLRLQLETLRETDASLKRLRASLGFPAMPNRKRIAADVIGIRPIRSMATLLINRGTRDGLSNRSVVMAPEGLVGRVMETTPTTATVLLLADRNSSVGAMVQRVESRAFGICKGNGTQSVSMVYLESPSDIRVGDIITSSGLGGLLGIFPKGLVIGTVTEVGEDTTPGARRAEVRLAVDMNRLEEVYILQ